MSKHVVKSLGDEPSASSWPVPNAKVVQLNRTLRSTKPDVHYYLTSPLPPKELGAEALSRTPSQSTPSVIPGAVASADYSSPTVVELQGVEDDVFLPQPPPLADIDNINPLNLDVVDLDNDANPELDVEEMAEERTLIPSPFSGSPDEDPAEFWRRLDNYVVYKNLAPDARIKLAKAMFVQVACDWLDSLEDDKKDTYEHLKAAFAERFIQPSILRFKSAKEIFGKKQGVDETVDTYANRLRNLGKKIGLGMEDNTLLYAFLSGLKPNLSSFVIGKNPQLFAEAIDAARIAELSAADLPASATEQLLVDQMAEIKKEMQLLTKQRDTSRSLTASIGRRSPENSPSRRVTFEDDARMARQREFDERRPTAAYRQPRTYQQRGPFKGQFQQPAGAQNFRYSNPQGQMQQQSGFTQRFRAPSPRPMGPQQQRRFQGPQGPRMGPRCNKCGRAPHTNLMYCPAVNQICSYCNRYGHFKAVCRTAASE